MLEGYMLSVLFEAVFGRLDYKWHTAKDKTDKAEACRKRLILKAVRKYVREHSDSGNHSYSNRNKGENRLLKMLKKIVDSAYDFFIDAH